MNTACVKLRMNKLTTTFTKARVILPGEKALIVDRFNLKIYMSLTLTKISHKLETSCCSLVFRVLCYKSQGPRFNPWEDSCAMFYIFFFMCMTCMVWYTQVELVLVVSVLTRKFRKLYNKLTWPFFKRVKRVN